MLKIFFKSFEGKSLTGEKLLLNSEIYLKNEELIKSIKLKNGPWN